MSQSFVKFGWAPRIAGLVVLWVMMSGATAHAMRQAQPAPAARAGGEAHLVLPDLGTVSFLGVNARTLLEGGLGVCVLGLLFGLVTFSRLKHLPVHRSMLEVSELIYETCKTYLTTQVRFIGILWLFIGAIMVVYFKFLATDAAGDHMGWGTVGIILLFSIIGICGSVGVAWFGIRVNTFANSRMAFASLRAKAVPAPCDPARGRHEHRHAAHQRRAPDHAVHPAVHSRRLRRAVLHRIRDRRVARRRGAADRRRHLHEDRGHRLRPDEDRLQYQGGRCEEPRRHRGLHGRQRRRLGGAER